MNDFITVNKDVSVDVDIDVEDFIGEIETDSLINELKTRGFKASEITVQDKEMLYEDVCDVFGLNHHTSLDELMMKVREELESQIR